LGTLARDSPVVSRAIDADEVDPPTLDSILIEFFIDSPSVFIVSLWILSEFVVIFTRLGVGVLFGWSWVILSLSEAKRGHGGDTTNETKKYGRPERVHDTP